MGPSAGSVSGVKTKAKWWRMVPKQLGSGDPNALKTPKSEIVDIFLAEGIRGRPARERLRLDKAPHFRSMEPGCGALPEV